MAEIRTITTLCRKRYEVRKAVRKFEQSLTRPAPIRRTR